MALYIGLMSGTSMDGVDAALVDLTEAGGASLIATHTESIPPSLLSTIIRLSQNRGTPDELGHCDRQLGELFAQAAAAVSSKRPTGSTILAIGSHGQTIRHQPVGAHPFTLQLGDPNLIAERTGITTVADFRRRDMAAGGQGAPLVPAFHHAMFGSDSQNRALINIGGIANISWLPAGRNAAAGGFDTGPGNSLMDNWAQRHLGKPFDHNGSWAASGKLLPDLLKQMLEEPYFGLPSPKSTGKELFNGDWLDARSGINRAEPVDVQRTLLELTAMTIIRQLPSIRPLAVYVCGGGARNLALMARLQELLTRDEVSVSTTSELGIDSQWVEAAAFAWLASQALAGLPGNVPAVTGASGPRILGAIYPP